MTIELSHRYFTLAKSPFFCWGDHGSVLQWDQGPTIAFGEELAAVLTRVAPQCVPPLNAIAVLLSACRGNWPEVRGQSYQLFGNDPRHLIDDPGCWEASQLREIQAELDRIHELPEDLRRSLDARCELAAMVFESHTGGWSEPEGQWLAEQIRAGLPDGSESPGGLSELIRRQELAMVGAMESTAAEPLLVLVQKETRKGVTALVRDLLWLRDGLPRVTAEALRRRVRTGLEDDIQVGPEDHSRSVRELIAGLTEDAQLGAIARLARDLLAVVHFPRSLSEQDQLPLGGVSDITNRGPLDRLLLSELAHDDLTLAVRVAVNEAMYLRRESPPRARPLARHVLIDSGLCMWGLPRVYGLSTALAMAATAGGNTQLRVWRAEGERLAEIDLTTREGLEQHLEVVAPELHAGPAIGPFVASEDVDDETEFVVVTSQEVAADTDFRAQLNSACADRPVFLMSVARDGRFEFSLHNPRGSRVIRTAQMDLEAVLMSAEDKPILREGTPDGLPAILSKHRLPIRLSHPIDPKSLFEVADGTAAATSDGRLMLWTDAGYGAIQLSDQLGRGRLLWQGWDDNGDVLAVYGRLMRNGLSILRMSGDRDVEFTKLDCPDRPVGVTGFGGQVFIIYADEVVAYVPGRTEPIGDWPIASDMRWQNSETATAALPNSASSRFFIRTGRRPKFFAIAPTGFTEVPCPPETLRLFDCRRRGVYGFLHDDRLWCSWDNGDPKRVGRGTKVLAVSIDGSRVVTPCPEGTGVALNAETPCSVLLGHVRDEGAVGAYHRVEGPVWKRPLDAVSPVATARIHDRAQRNRFDGIGVLDGRIHLRAVSGNILEIDSSQTPRLHIVGRSSLATLLPFRTTASPHGTGYSLRIAEWPDGSKVWLDSRCLLHLSSSDRSVPECTIVLADGLLSGWCEEGGSFGKAYHAITRREPDADRDAQILQKAIDGFARCL